MRGSIQDFTFAADQRNIGAQYHSGFCLQNGEAVPIDLNETAHHFKLAANQSFAEAKCRHTVSLIIDNAVHRYTCGHFPIFEALG
jgi:TPR repeat protein